MSDHTIQEVKERLVFYVPGFDPMPPNRYREGYKSEGAKQAEVSGYDITVQRISTLNETPRFQSETIIDGQTTSSEFRFFTWNMLVHKTMNVPIWKSWLAMLRVGRTYVISGSLRALMRLHFPPSIPGVYPFVMIPLQIFISLWIALKIGCFASGFVPTAPWDLVIKCGLALAISSTMIIWFRRLDDKLLAYYMLHDLDYFTREDGYTQPELRARMKMLKQQITDATTQNFDEILLVGHSSGAHLAVIVLAELVREGVIKREDHVALLTLGQSIPMVSYLKGARDLRLALHELGTQDVVDWVDFTAPSDGASFALRDPVSCSVGPVKDQKYPRVLSCAFRLTISPETYKKIRWRFFRLHFQYICHFDRPNVFDYFAITSGPRRLWSRFGDMADSPSTVRTNLNPYCDRAP